MPLFRRKSEKLPKTSSLSLYGQGRAQTPPCTGEKYTDKASSVHTVPSEDRMQPFLAFAEVTYDPSLPIRHKSRLSKSLEEVLHDNAALAYFIQFMDCAKAQHLVKFWLEAESFKVSTQTRLNSVSGPCLTSIESSHISPLLSSDSSGCVSDRSDEGTQPSSHVTNCNSLCDKSYVSDKTLLTSQIHTCDRTSQDDNISSALNQISLDNDIVCGDSKENGHFVNNGDISSSPDSQTNDAPVLEQDQNGVYADITNVTLNFESGISCTDLEGLNCNREQTNTLERPHTSVEQDAKAIYDKYIDATSACSVGITDELRTRIKDSIFQHGGTVEPSCFVEAQEFVVKRMDEEYFQSFLRSSFHCKHQIDVLTSGNVYLADVLYNDSALFYFMEFVEQERVRHLVDFLLMADNFSKHLLSQESYDAEQAQNDAMIIYEKYFSLQATMPLGFSDSIRYDVEQNICREDGPLPDCFLKPVRILTQYLEKTYLLHFLNNQLYFKYISECIITIQSGAMDLPAQQKNPGSESGSEHSLPISSVNTLLAMDGKQPGTSSKLLKNIVDQDMRIDNGHFKPDSLWQRQFAGKLQMAHIDNLGRLVTEFEPEPDRKKESRISKAVKKLVTREDDKTQEDMAWKVAEMIVQDICSITMPEGFEKQNTEDPP